MNAGIRLAYAAEHALTRALARGAELKGRRRARRRRVDRAYLRGRRCHCPPGLPMHLVHSEGIREACDVVIDHGSNVEHPSRPHLPVDALAPVMRELRCGDAVHVKTELLGSFVDRLLPSIAEPIVLVTGDSDDSAVKTFEPLLVDDRIAHWFAQNCDVAWHHPKLTRLPIGVDNPVFTKIDKRLGFLLTMLLRRTPMDRSLRRNDVGDQATLQRVKAATGVPLRDKPPRVLCTFHQNSKLLPSLDGVPERGAAYAALVDNACCEFAPRRLRQDEYWAAHARFAFEAAPRGKGLDTLRTWECLFLETIPIVRTSPLDALFEQEDLPVVIVDSYREITPERLTAWKREHETRFTADVARRLTNDYWVDKIRAAQARARDAH